MRIHILVETESSPQVIAVNIPKNFSGVLYTFPLGGAGSGPVGTFKWIDGALDGQDTHTQVKIERNDKGELVLTPAPDDTVCVGFIECPDPAAV